MDILGLNISLKDLLLVDSNKMPVLQVKRLSKILAIAQGYKAGSGSISLEFLTVLAQLIAGYIADKHPEHEISQEYKEKGTVSEETEDQILFSIGSIDNLVIEIQNANIPEGSDVKIIGKIQGGDGGETQVKKSRGRSDKNSERQATD